MIIAKSYLSRVGLWALQGFFLFFALASMARAQATDMLPDVIVVQNYLYQRDIVESQGHTYLRFSNATANIGAGPLYFYGAPPDGANTQPVMQRIFRTDGSHWDRVAGSFIYHPTHNHVHFEDWCSYLLRQVTANNGVGEVVAQSSKVSFCVLDLYVYNNALPGFNSRPEFTSCGATVQGSSVGWGDVYTLDLPGQSIDITGIPEGTYWLESEVDPGGAILEVDENNNIARVKVSIGQASPIVPDRFEPNDSPAEVLTSQVGAMNSANLGPCGPLTVISGLNVHEPDNDDYFRFYMNHAGVSGDFIRIDLRHVEGDLDLELLNANLQSQGKSELSSNIETVSLSGKPEGWYYARVFGFQNAVNNDYTLTINPSQNQAPTITTLSPGPAGDTIIQGLETFGVTWSYADPESDQCWVSVYVNSTTQFDGNEHLMTASLNTAAAQQFFVINSAELDTGTYYVYCEITDGGVKTGDWSAGTLTIVANFNQPPTVPSPITPSDSTGLAFSLTPRFTWAAAGDPDLGDTLFYILQVATDTAFTQIISRDTVDALTIRIGDTLQPDTAYYWRVEAVDPFGQESGFSPATSFATWRLGDLDHDDQIDLTDLGIMIDFFFFDGGIDVFHTADFNRDCLVDIGDLGTIIDFLFFGGSFQVPCLQEPD